MMVVSTSILCFLGAQVHAVERAPSYIHPLHRLLPASQYIQQRIIAPDGGGGQRYGKGARNSRPVWANEANAIDPMMRPRNGTTGGIKTGAPPLSGRSMAGAWLLAKRCPGYRWRDSNLGFDFDMELEYRLAVQRVMH